MNISHVSVDLSGRDVAVSEHRLNGTGVGAVLQEVRRETVSKGVWRDVLDSRFFGVTPDHRPGQMSIEWLAPVKEHVG